MRINFVVSFALTIGLASSQVSAFFWDGGNVPILAGIGEQLFPQDAFEAPTYVYQTSNTKFTNVNENLGEPGQEPVVELAQADPKFNYGASARPPSESNPNPQPQYLSQVVGSSNNDIINNQQMQPINEILLPIPGGQPTVYGPLPSPMIGCPPGFLCCDAGAVYRNTFKLLSCCGENSFDMRFERCMGGIVSPLRRGEPTLTPAERLSHITCGESLYFGPSILRCCNGTFYDSTKFTCTEPAKLTTTTAKPAQWNVRGIPRVVTGNNNNNNVNTEDFEMPDGEPGPLGNQYVVCEIYRYKLSPRDLQFWGCCGAQLYHYRRENCTGGEILPQRTLERQKMIPHGELMVYCPGGVQHWVDPATLAHTRCCGSRLCPLFEDRKRK